MLRQRFIMSLGVILIGLFLFQTTATYIYTHYIMPDPFKKPSIAETEANGEISFKNGHSPTNTKGKMPFEPIDPRPGPKELWKSLKADASDSPFSYLQYVILISLFSFMVWKLVQSRRVKKRRRSTGDVTDDVPFAQSIFHPASLRKSSNHLICMHRIRLHVSVISSSVLSNTYRAVSNVVRTKRLKTGYVGLRSLSIFSCIGISATVTCRKRSSRTMRFYASNNN